MNLENVSLSEGTLVPEELVKKFGQVLEFLNEEKYLMWQGTIDMKEFFYEDDVFDQIEEAIALIDDEVEDLGLCVVISDTDPSCFYFGRLDDFA